MAASIVGLAQTRIGRRDGRDLGSPTMQVTRESLAHATVRAAEVDALRRGNLDGDLVPETFDLSLLQMPGAEQAGLFNRGGTAVASDASNLERAR